MSAAPTTPPLTKAGTGTWTLFGANTYSGLTTIGGGALVINGTSGTGAVSVTSGTLLGRGTAPSGMLTVASGANLAPGATVAANGTTAATPGALTVGALTLSSGSNFNVLLGDNASATGAGGGTIYSQLIASGVTGLAGSNLNLNLTGTLAVGDKFFILDNTGAGTTPGTFANITGTTFMTGGDTFSINYGDTFDTTMGNDISLTVTAVPEPSTLTAGLICSGMLLLGLRRRLFASLTRRSSKS